MKENGSVDTPKIVVGIATRGRREILSQMLGCLSSQSRRPDHVIICRASPADVDEQALEAFPKATVVPAAATGSSPQRNQIISLADDGDIIVFFDDDFFPAHHYLENLATLFRENPDITSATGTLLEDGAHGPGLSVEQGLDLLRALEPVAFPPHHPDCYGTYGCNMAFRLKPIIENKITFDENLPLYGWQEDIDFSRSLSRFGRIVKSEVLQGVHLGAKAGRTSGVRFGYSQISNPLFLIRKGTMSWRHAGKLMWRNLAANTVRSLRPEPWIDRRGRLRGNVLALLDLARGRIQPDRILKLD